MGQSMETTQSNASDRIRLGVSACLLGEEVRHDGGHKRDRFITDMLGPYVEWVPVCPEVEIGLGIPRDTLRLVGTPKAPRLVQDKTGEDLTERMQRYAEDRVRALADLDLDGYLLKRASPSCGLFRVRVYRDNGIPAADGRGLFAAALTAALPALPVEEEGRLNNLAIRENFIERVFHAAHKFAVLAHSPEHHARLGRMVAAAGALTRAKLDAYHALLMEAFTVRATRGRHANVLHHMAGYFKQDLAADERAELVEIIYDYRRGLVPLVVPLTLVKHHVRRLGVGYLADQVYLSPHPKELMLRNHV